jgi:glutathione synthase
VSADPATIKAFVADHGRAVLKPIDGFAGRGVVMLADKDPNLSSLIEISTEQANRTVVVQKYLDDVAEGNKRLFMMDGECLGAVWRFPADGDFRIGYPAASAPVTSRDQLITSRTAAVLGRSGLRLLGLDVIGDQLIEVNVTSPGAMHKTDALVGSTLCEDITDRILHAPRQKGQS